MKLEKLFLALIIAAAAVALLDLAYLVYIFVSIGLFSAGAQFSLPALFPFSLAVSIINFLLIVFAAAYYIVRKKQ